MGKCDEKRNSEKCNNCNVVIVAERDTHPYILQADNGIEFLGETTLLMKNIVHIKTLSYIHQPQMVLVEGKRIFWKNVKRGNDPK